LAIWVQMAANLIKHGHSLVVNDVNVKAVEELKAKGAEVAASPKDLAAKVNTIVTMLPSSPHVKEVYLNPQTGLYSNLQPGTLCVDSSTIDPATSREVALKIKNEREANFVDAPVSGGVLGAEAGTLTFMVGAKPDLFEKVKILLQKMGKNIVHCGDTGTGQVAKICNNLVLAISMIGVSEAMNLGIKLGIDSKVLAGIFNTSSARCWSSDTYNPVPGVMPNVPASRGYTGGFGVDLMAKDISLAVNAAHSVKASLPLGGPALQIYNLLSAHGGGNKDFSAIYEYLSTTKSNKN